LLRQCWLSCENTEMYISGTFFALYKIEVRKGKPSERMGRKANGLREKNPMAAGLPKPRFGSALQGFLSGGSPVPKLTTGGEP